MRRKHCWGRPAVKPQQTGDLVDGQEINLVTQEKRMNVYQSLKRGLFFVLPGAFLSTCGYAAPSDIGPSDEWQEIQTYSPCHHRPRANPYELGTAAYVNFDPSSWYPLAPPQLPNTTQLSANRNRGQTQGGVQLTSSGLFTESSGNYSASFAVVLQNTSGCPITEVVFLAVNGVVDTNNPVIAGSVLLASGAIGEVRGSGILQDLPPNADLSLFVSDATGASHTLNVGAWQINLARIPSDPAARSSH